MLEYNYTIPGNDLNSWNINLSNVFRQRINDLTKEFVPQYLSEMPFLRGRLTKLYLDEAVLVFVAEYDLCMSAAILSSLSDKDLIDKSIELLKATSFPDYSVLNDLFGNQYLSAEKFLIVTSVSEGKISSEHFETVLVDWLNDKVLPKIMEDNKQRVLDAIPAGAQYDIQTVFDNVFVLDDTSDNLDDLGRQGTCFYLKNVGFVTCNHVLTDEIQCFHPRRPGKRYSVNVISQNETIDLAILKIDDLLEDYDISGLECGCADNLQQMDHIAVAGFPNYQIGDTGVLSPGLVIGFRPTHGIRRLLVNAAIVCGNSGGPVLDANNCVIGIAVTGADCSEQIMTTENHGVIPIEALSYL